MSSFFAFIFVIAFFTCIGLCIYGIVAKIRHKPLFSKFKKIIIASILVFLVACVGVGATASTSDDNQDSVKTSSSASEKDESSKKAASESIEKDKESSSIAAASSQAEASSKAKQESTAASVKASSEATAASEKAAHDASVRDASISESRARDASNAAAAQQQAQTVVAPDPSPAPAENSNDTNAGGTSGYRWAIQDGFTWQTRKGHSRRIAPGGALPAGYHWQVP
ncbi:hypothetical protein [Leuconostoc citreum]|uniref:hypothetical protein n=1 Tax=Leuconostoc citreum TaxID=33964 RepID=UPI00209EAA75|nr:hypothetical protein [Leuconostoc citreum]MCP1275456.1 hypothetical protein [Leuconostoc citreum]